MTRIHVPLWLYWCWPWIVFSMAAGFTYVGEFAASILLSCYAGWVFGIRRGRKRNGTDNA